MSTVSPKEAWDKSFSEGVGIEQFALGLDLTLKALQMALDNHDSSLTIPILLEGLQNVDIGYSVTVKSERGDTYTIGPIDQDDKSFILAKDSSRVLADQIVNLRRHAQSTRMDINSVR